MDLTWDIIVLLIGSRAGRARLLPVLDMAKDFAKAFYDSAEWHTCRDAYRASVGGLCERCLKKGEVKAGEIVHHKIYLTPRNINDPSVTLNFKNLELVCLDCHNAEHTPAKRRYTFTARGDLTPPVVDRRSQR